MKISIRTNPKSGKTQYKCRYSWKDGDGKRKDSNTGWFPTEKQAFDNAVLLKEKKEKAARVICTHIPGHIS